MTIPSFFYQINILATLLFYSPPQFYVKCTNYKVCGEETVFQSNKPSLLWGTFWYAFRYKYVFQVLFSHSYAKQLTQLQCLYCI
jgi:hypothetical protein